MVTNLSAIQNIAYALKQVNKEVEESMLMSKILSTLPEEYKHFRSAWDSTAQGDKKLTNLCARLQTEEQILKKDQHVEQVCFKAEQTKKLRCFICNELGHVKANCKKELKQCKHCKKSNHIEKNCFF